MINLQRFRQSMMSLCLAGFLSIAALLCLAPAPVLAATPPLTLITQPNILMLFGSNKAKVAAKDLAGKSQETMGKVTGDRGDQLAGKAKQADAKVRNTVQDVKDKVGMG